MTTIAKIGFAAALCGLALTTPAKRASALSCASNTEELIYLGLESVTEDGVELLDVSDYDAFGVHLVGSPYGGDSGFTLFAIEGESNTWREDYR